MHSVVVNYEPNRIIELQHPLTDQSGNRFVCECGLEYTQESYVEEGTSKLYTRIGVAHIKYFSLKCPRNTCDKKFVDASGTWGMFFIQVQPALVMKSGGILFMQLKH